MGLGGPNLVKGATGQVVDAESLGGARTHTEVSGVAHYAVENDAACLREAARRSCRGCRAATRRAVRATRAESAEAARESLYDLLPHDHRMSYDMHAAPALPSRWRRARRIPAAIARGEMLCGHGRIRRHAGRRHRQPARTDQGTRRRERPRFGGIVYAESAEKVAYLHRPRNRERHPDAVRAGRHGLHGRPGRRARRASSAPARSSSKRWPRRSCPRSCSRSITPRAPAITPWRGRDSIPTSSSRGRRGAWG